MIRVTIDIPDGVTFAGYDRIVQEKPGITETAAWRRYWHPPLYRIDPRIKTRVDKIVSTNDGAIKPRRTP